MTGGVKPSTFARDKCGAVGVLEQAATQIVLRMRIAGRMGSSSRCGERLVWHDNHAKANTAAICDTETERLPTE